MNCLLLLLLIVIINVDIVVNNGVTAEASPSTDDEKCAMLQRCVDSVCDETKCSFIIQINSDQCNLTSSNQTQVGKAGTKRLTLFRTKN